MSGINIRKLAMEDFKAFAKLRALALNTEPSSFWGTVEEEAPVLKERYESRVAAESNFSLGAFSDDYLVGLMAFVRQALSKLAHKGGINGVFVHPDFRGLGIANKLLTETLRQAFTQEGLRNIVLTVTAGNEPAKRLYEKHGFVEFGYEKDGLVVNGVAYDQHWMQLEKHNWNHESF